LLGEKLRKMLNKKKININDLSEDGKAILMKSELGEKSYFEELFPGKSMVKIECQDFYQKFRYQIERLLVKKGVVKKVDFPLEETHLYLSQEMRDYNINDGVNKISTFFYENDEEFNGVYLDFIKKFLKRQFKFPFYFQSVPTIRFHCPDAKNSNHYPRYHTDIGYGHPPQEINLWQNLTKPVGKQKHGFRVANLKDSLSIYKKYNYNFNTIVEKAITDKEFNNSCNKIAPEVDNKEGEILVMDSRCWHSGEPLVNHTRVSMDIRIIPVSKYEKLPIIYQGAGRMKILFAPGGCYHSLNSNQL
jgi:hypothetical protein